MNKIFLGIVLGLGLSFGTLVLATPEKVENYVDNGIQFLRGSFNVGDVYVESFIDDKTDVVCYVSIGHTSGYAFGYNSSISCIKIK